jgi:hypothetical protein
MNKRPETIALLEWNWMGHHPTYFTHFAAAMAEAGADVVPFCADPDDFAKRLAGIDLGNEGLVRIARAERVEGPRPSNFRPARWRGIYEARKFFGGLGKQLRAWETKHGRKIDLVFFACIYDWEFEHFRSAERTFGFPWSGLYLHARALRMPGQFLPYRRLVPKPERVFGGLLVRSVALLDEGVLDGMRQITRTRRVVAFPDITDATLPSENASAWGLAKKLQEFARGRRIVSLLGYLQQTKGVEEFLALSKDARMQNVVFFLGGEPALDGFDDASVQRLRETWEQTPNVWAHLQRLPEQVMNAVLSVSDVVFAAYRNFPNSSNVLTKAAMFERPVVVSEGFLMAERVRGYGLGEVVPEGDVEALAATTRRMLTPGYYESLAKRAKWADYREAHSVEGLKKAMGELLAGSLP